MEILDRTDILILRELQKDAKLTTKELAAKEGTEKVLIEV